MHIDHVNICAPKELMEKLKVFYCETLELSVGFRPKFSNHGYWLYAGDKAIVHLSDGNRHLRQDMQGYFDHFAIQTTGLEKLKAKLPKRLLTK